jgi:hypothetical protein
MQLEPGTTLKRKAVHELFGGRQQGGIGPSSKTPNVLFFTDPASGRRHGYYDGWDADGLFNYTGEGQVGEQRLVQGNKAILNHREDGRDLLGFSASGSDVTYMGKFELVDFHWTEAPDTNGQMRPVVVFRLRPVDGGVPVELPTVPYTIAGSTQTMTVSIEEFHTERAVVDPSREPYEVERRESALVTQYANHLRNKGHVVGRLMVVPEGERSPLYSDLWDETSGDLIEAKGIATRENIRMAVGQLLDYGRFVEHKTKTVLLPSKPRKDLIRYLNALEVEVVYPDGVGWVRN